MDFCDACDKTADECNCDPKDCTCSKYSKRKKETASPVGTSTADVAVLGTIYKIVNQLNGKIYIGQTTQKLNRRWYKHVYDAVKLQKKHALANAIRFYGKDSFTIEAIEVTEVHKLLPLEIEYIAAFNTYTKGYNSTKGGEGGLGRKQSEDFKKLMSKIHSGNKYSVGKTPWNKDKIGVQRSEKSGKTNEELYGKEVADKIREKLSLSHIGKTPGNKGKKTNKPSWNRGVAMSQSSKDKMVISKVGNKRLIQKTILGELVETFISAGEAARKLGKGKSHICEAANGKISTAYGYRWEYVTV